MSRRMITQKDQDYIKKLSYAIDADATNGTQNLELQSDVINLNANETCIDNGDVYLPTIEWIHLDGRVLPAIPTNAGTYVLKATVDASGKPTFAWIAA